MCSCSACARALNVLVLWMCSCSKRARALNVLLLWMCSCSECAPALMCSCSGCARALHGHDEPNELTKEGPLSYVLYESQFVSVSTVSRGTPLWSLWSCYCYYYQPKMLKMSSRQAKRCCSLSSLTASSLATSPTSSFTVCKRFPIFKMSDKKVISDQKLAYEKQNQGLKPGFFAISQPLCQILA